MSDIFISYASEDRQRVQGLARALEQKGWSVWWDRRIRTGGAFDEVIQKALGTAKSVVVVWTESSIKSTWVKNEARKGMRRGILFPVMLLDEVEIPLEFEHLQAAHLMGWQPDQGHAGFDQFIDDIAQLIGTPTNSVIQQPPVTQSQEPLPAPTISTPESASLPKTAALGANNNLSALTVSPGSLSPAFSANTLNYTVNVGGNVAIVTVSATKADPNAVMSEDVTAAAGTATGQAPIQLAGPGSNTLISIVVTAPNGTQKTYTVNVSRAALRGNNNLQSLTVSPGTLVPSFSASRIFYTVNVDDNITSVTVTPTLQDTNSSMTINGQGTSSGQAGSISLNAPGSSTEIDITAIAPNDSYKTYLITVSRAALSRAAEVEPEPERLEPRPSAPMAGAVNSDSPRESFSSQPASEFSGGGQVSSQAGDDRSSESTSSGGSAEFLPYLPIGIGILAVIGALFYFAVFSQGPFPGKRNEVQYQPTVQLPSTSTEVSRSSSVPQPVQQPSAAPTETRPTVKQGASPAKTITGKDGAPMVLIPAGEFQMGSPDSEGSMDEHPRHQVTLDGFYMDKFEVTVARYTEFVRAKNRPKPDYWDQVDSSKHRNLPVVGVDWHDARAYCEWAGKRLPTEAEWEKAARGTDGRTYPWGNEGPTARLANFAKGFTMRAYEERLAPVDSYEAGNSPYGLHHMAGNVWEWTADWYDANYYSKSPERNPAGPASGEYRVLRGGSWFDGPDVVRSADRNRLSPTKRVDDIGFRCAQDVPK